MTFARAMIVSSDLAVNRRYTQTIIEFLSEIGLEVHWQDGLIDTFLPGVKAMPNGLAIDVEQLKWPGDILHEAGHIALLSPTQRQQWSGDFSDAEGFELGAIAWSYAASVYIDLPIDVLFHAGGYKGDAAWLADLFASGSNVGVPILQWRGLSQIDGDSAYPVMQKWLCTED